MHFLQKETKNYISRPGKVEITYPNGDVYRGLVNADGLKHDPEGEYIFNSTKSEEEEEDSIVPVYKGSYELGQRAGLGAMKCKDGSEYRGMWKDNQYNGKGALTYPNGDIYSGEWKDVSQPFNIINTGVYNTSIFLIMCFAKGMRHGRGTYLFQASEARLKGEWHQGSILQGEFQHADGTTYAGSFEGNSFNGPGTYSFNKSGLHLKGQFIVSQEESGNTVRWVTEQLA